jgi:hypothetical protein
VEKEVAAPSTWLSVAPLVPSWTASASASSPVISAIAA